MATYALRLIGPRPTFAQDMSDEEMQVMGQHAAHWGPYIEKGQMVVFGPILDETGSYGLAVLESEDENEIRAHAADDPAVLKNGCRYEIGTMLQGFVRPAG